MFLDTKQGIKRKTSKRSTKLELVTRVSLNLKQNQKLTQLNLF